MRYIFVSDAHLGLDIKGEGDERVERFISFLGYAHRELKHSGGALFMLGDIFDFWFEYKRVEPKGFDSIIAAIREITLDGIQVHFFKGNHDMWMVGHFERMSGAVVHRKAKEFTLNGKRLLLAHGDRYGVNMWRYPLYAIMYAAFTSPAIYAFCRAILPVKFMYNVGVNWSKSSRKAKKIAHTFREEREPLVKYSRKYLEHTAIDYFVYGHLHCQCCYRLTDSTRLYILGEWIDRSDYMLLDEDGEPQLLTYVK